MRQLYTDQDEILFDAARPVILNGIEGIVTRPDLADRAIFLTLDAIPEERCQPEKELWTEFNAARPKLLGTLLDAVAHGLKRLPDTRLDSLPRMADFALWATACETALWKAGTFSTAYAGNRDEAIDSVIEADPVGSAIRSLISTQTEWKGTASNLLGVLDEEVGEKVRKSKAWPSSARALSGRVRRAATFLRKVGIDITFEREGRARTPGSFAWPTSWNVPRQDRPHRCRKQGETTALIEANHGRPDVSRMQTLVALSPRTSAAIHPKTKKWLLRAVWTQVRRPTPVAGGHGCERC